jgi:uncharacterized lipoprotein YddW (UPF0748 family)
MPSYFKRVVWVGFALVILVVFSHRTSEGTLPERSRCEVRGVWLNAQAFSSEQGRQDILKKIDGAHMNTLFLLAPPVQGYPGWSTHEAFSAMLKEGVSRRLSMHGWIPNGFRVSGGTDFTLAHEQIEQSQWAMAMLETYPALDGVHFDYIRFRNWEDMDAHKMGSVSTVVRLAFQAIHYRYPRKFLTTAVLSATPNRAQSAKESLPEWFVTWMKANPGNRYASSFPGETSYVPEGLKYQQDAIGWLREGNVDAIMPMEYTTDDHRWQENAKSWLSFRYGEPCGVYLGLGWLTEKGKPDWGYDASGIVRKIRYGRNIGLRGFVIFELSAFRDIDYALVDALSVDSVTNDFSAPFKTTVESCLSSKGSRCQETDRLNSMED